MERRGGKGKRKGVKKKNRKKKNEREKMRGKNKNKKKELGKTSNEPYLFSHSDFLITHYFA